MATPIFDPAQPFTAVEGETLDSLVPSVVPPVVRAPATPTFDPAQPFTPVPEASGPVFDPAQPFTALSEQATPNVYTLDSFKTKTPEELAGDKAFSPVQFGAQNLDTLDPEQLEKLRQVYVAKEATGTTALEKAKATFSGVLPALKTIYGGAEQVAKTAQKFSPQGIAEALQRVVKGESASDVGAEFVQAAVEVPASVEASAVGTTDLLRRSARAITEAPLPVRAALLGPTGVVTGSEPVAEQSEQKSRERLFDDIEGLKAAERAGQGNAEVMRLVGLDADTLAQANIKLDPDAIAKLSVVTDPINYIPFGGAIGAVSKIGGKAVTTVIGTAISAEKAAQMAKILNQATAAAAKAKSVTGSVVGSAAEATGAAIEGVGKAARKAVGSLGGTASGIGLGGLLGGNVYSALGGAAIAKGVPKGIQAAGRGIRATGEMISGTRPVPAGLLLAGDVAKAGAVGAAKGVAEGGVISAPFLLGARPEEEENILGMVGLGAGIRAGLEGAAPAGKAVGKVAQNKLAESIFRRVEQTDAPEHTTYGTEPKLDSADATGTLPAPGKKLVNWGRALLREAGGEVYTLPNAEFVKAAGDTGLGYAVRIGEKIAPDGTATPLVRIFLNASSDALPHEFFHALESIDPAQADALKKSVQSEWSPEQRNFFEHYYNTLRNRGLPESQWKHRLTDEQVAGEAAAEVFSRLFLAQDLTGVAPSIAQQAALFTSSLIDKLGAPLAAVGRAPGEAGVSTLGVRPGVQSTKLGQTWLANLLQRVDETGSLGEAPKPTTAFGGLTAADISGTSISKKPPGAPKTPPPAAPPVAPAPIGPVTPTPPVVPAPVPGPRNIRTTKAAQDDFAGRRAEETGTAQARTLAEKSADPAIIARVNQISDLIESGAPVIEIEHSSVISAGDAKKPSGRSARRSEQEAAYIAEGLGAAPESVRNTYQKVFVPVRWETVGGKPQLLAMSLDKVIANAHFVAKEASVRGVGDLVPYEIFSGKLTEAGWKAFTQDLRDYAANQQNGYRGDGQRLLRPAEDIGLSIPAENPAYSPVQLGETKANFLNVTMGTDGFTPLTAREVAGKIPGNVKGQILAEVNQKTIKKPAVIRAEDVGKQTFKTSGRDIMEMNRTRNNLAEAGVPVRELLEVTERINAESINNVTPRPDLDFSAPVTDTIRGGFLPNTELGKTLSDRGITFELSESEVNVSPRAGGYKLRAIKDGKEIGVVEGSIVDFGAEIENISVIPEMQGQKVGEALYRELGQFLRDSGVTEIGGDVIDPAALSLRKKVFPNTSVGPKKIYGPGRETLSTINSQSSFLPEPQSGKTVSESVNRASKATPEDFAAMARTWEGGLTREAYRIGLNVKTKEDLLTLKMAQAQSSARIKTMMKTGNFDQAMSLAALPQLFREAYEAATDSGSAAGPNGWRHSYPDAVPPFPERGPDSARGDFLPGVETDKARKAGLLPDAKPASRSPSEPIRTIASDYAKSAGIDYAPSRNYAEVNPDLARRLADFYDDAQHSPDDPAVQASYTALADETMAQYSALTDAGYVLEPFTGEGEPYKSSAEAVADARDNKHLFFLKTEGNFSGEQNNPMLAPAGDGLVINDVFRGVHDFFGHAKEGNQFGPRGEFNAWKNHSEMFSEAAQGALAAETLAQNSWVNFGKHLKEGTPLKDRPFAEQKNIVVPPELIAEAQGSFLPTGREYEARRAAEKLKPVPSAKKSPSTSSNPTAWILPDGNIKPLTTAFHENDLAANSKTYAEQFGTKFSDKSNFEDRIQALNAGFVRMRYRPDGSMMVEIGAEHLNKQRGKLIDTLIANADKIDKFRIGVLDRKGNTVDSFDDNQVFRAEDRGAALEAAVNGLKAVKRTAVGPSAITRARQFGVSGDFLPGYIGEVDGLDITAARADLSRENHDSLALNEGEGSNRFRYNPNTEKVYWWNRSEVSPEVRDEVTAWLKKRGEKVKGHVDITAGHNYEESHGRRPGGRFLPEKTIAKSPFSVQDLKSSDLPQFLPRFISAPDRIPDVLDAIYELGGIASPRKSKFPKGGEFDGYNEAFGVGIARLLRRYNRGRGLAPDELRDSLVENYGFRRLESTSDLYDMVGRATRRRKAVGQIQSVEAWETEDPF